MKIKDITIMALLIAASFILANLKIAGSIAFDSVPAFIALFIYKDNKAAIIGALAHLLSAALAGFALGLPAHLAIALVTFIMLFIAKYLVNLNTKIAPLLTIIFIVVINSFINPLVLFIFMPFSWQLYISSASLLLLATTLNTIIAFVLSIPLKGVVNNHE